MKRLPTRPAALLLGFASCVAPALFAQTPARSTPTPGPSQAAEATLANAVQQALALRALDVAQAAATAPSLASPTPLTPASAAQGAAEMVMVFSNPEMIGLASAASATLDKLSPEQTASITTAIKAFQDVRTAGPGGASPFTATELANVNETIRVLQGALARGTATAPSAPAPAGGPPQLPLALAVSFAESAGRGGASSGAGVPIARAARRIVAKGTTDLPGLEIDLQTLSESRSSSTGGGLTSLLFSLSGSGLPVNATVRQTTVTKATDDTGASLVSSRFTSGSSMSLMNSSGQPGSTVGASTTLGQAPRTATVIKALEGTIEFVTPTDANGGNFRIPNIKLHSGRIESPELSQRGIAVVFATDQVSYDDAVNLRTTSMGGRGGGGGSNIVVPDGKRTFVIYIQDTGNLAIGAQLQDSRGNPLVSRTSGGSSGSSSSGGVTLRYSFSPLTVDAGLPDDTQLVVFLATPEALKKVSFSFENVALP